MKTKFTLVILVLIPFLGIYAQKPILVSEDSLQIGKSILPGLSVTIPEVDFDKTLKTWITNLERGTKSRVVTDYGEMSIFGAKIKAVSPVPMNVYSRLVQLDSMLQLFVSFETKKDLYIERYSGESEYAKAQDYLKEFAKDQYIELVKGQADAEDKKLRDLHKELSSLEKEKSQMQKGIRTDNSNITSEKENIVIQTNEVNTVNAAIAEQNVLLAALEEGPARKEQAAQIKELEKRKKKAEKSTKSSENKISRADSDIDKATGDIPRNERMQEKVKDQIMAQEAVYQKYADKLKKIKSY